MPLITNTLDIISADLLEVAAKYVRGEFHKKGNSYIALSPFTAENTPSFTINERKSIWKCFSSGRGGNNPVSLVMACDNLSYYDALIKTAEIIGIPLQYANTGENDYRKDMMFQAVKFALEYYHNKAKNSKVCLDYIAHRHYSSDVIDTYTLGYADGELTNTILKYGFDIETLCDVGLSYKADDGTYRDAFNYRLLFPLHDTRGRLCGFTGRTLGNSKAKYINSKDSPIFSKSEAIFSKIVNRSDALLWIVEGQFNVLRLNSVGLNAVAVSGTALSFEQIKFFKKYTNKLVLGYDNDDAGRRALAKHASVLLMYGFELFIPEYVGDGNDLDAIIKTPNDVPYLAGYIDFLISNAKDVDSIKEAAQNINCIKDKVLKQIYLNQLSQLTKISSDILCSEVKVIEVVEIEPVGISRKHICEFNLIYAVLHAPNELLEPGITIGTHFIENFKELKFMVSVYDTMRIEFINNGSIAIDKYPITHEIEQLTKVPETISSRWEKYNVFAKFDFAKEYINTFYNYLLEILTDRAKENNELMKNEPDDVKQIELLARSQKINFIRAQILQRKSN